MHLLAQLRDELSQIVNVFSDDPFCLFRAFRRWRLRLTRWFLVGHCRALRQISIMP